MDKETQLTKEYLKAMGNKYDLEIIHILDLSKLGIRSFGSLVDCVSLSILDISRNQLRNIKGMEALVNLRSLNISYNYVNNIEPLRSMLELEDLQIQENKLDSYQSLEPLKKLSKLQYLRLQEYGQSGQNPVCKTDKYRRTILEMFPNLFSLDGHRRHNPFLEIDEKVKEILAREKVTISTDKDAKSSSWVKKEDLDPTKAFNKVKSAGGSLLAEIQGMIKDCDKGLKEYDKLLIDL